MKNLLLSLLFILLFFSCSKKGTITLTIQEPPQIKLSENIKKITIINRTIPAEETKVIDELEKVLTLEGVNLDKEASNTAIQVLKDELTNLNKYTEVKISEKQEFKTINAGTLPTVLSKEQVLKYCKEHKTDALISLELLDTDTKLQLKVNQTTINTGLGNIPAIEHIATLNTNVELGWRIYDPHSMNYLVNENRLNRNMSFTSKGINPLNAVQALTNRKQAVNTIAQNSAKEYVEMMVPYWIKVTRPYYVKGSNNLKIACRRAQAGNWDGAGELWKKDSENSKAKIAGRAAYNYAIYQEILGNLDEAIRWSQKAYEDYNEKLALNYIHILKNRKNKLTDSK